MKIQVFQRGETVPIWAEDKNWAGVLIDPSTGIKVVITDPDEKVVGDISVISSADFTVGLTVTGGTSGATGIILEKPNGTTLRLKQVTGIWQSGEAITDTGSGTSITSSTLVDIVMTWDAVGKYVFYYKSDIADPVGWWRYFCKAVDGAGDTSRTVITHGGFELQ